MKLLIFSLLTLSSLAFADDGEILKNLAAHPIHFDSAFDISSNSSSKTVSLYLFSSTEGIQARMSCARAVTAGLSTYLSFRVENRLGTDLGWGYIYLDSMSDCGNLLVDLFDNVKNYEYSFGKLDYWGNRPVIMTKAKK